MCAAADSGRANIPCLIRQRSVGDYVVIDEQPHSLARADPVYFPRGVVNGAFHQKTFAVSTPSRHGRGDSQPLIPLGDSHRVPVAVRSAATLARTKVNDRYGGRYKSYTLKQYTRLQPEHHDYYLLIEIDYPGVQFVYVAVRDGKIDVEEHDFLNKFNPSQVQDKLVENTIRSQWTTVSHIQPAPSDVTTATLLARHYVRAQHGEVPSYILMAYKKVSKENGYAKDFFLKMNIGSKCLFVKLSADHHGGADNVASAEYDFSSE